MNRSTAIIGGGAAGFFAAINLKEMVPDMDVTIFESGQKVLRKVEISGGGRCNCTNTFREVTDLSQVYPRGHRLLKRLFKGFNQDDAYQWFEKHGVKLTVQSDECIFPTTQDSHTIINTFLTAAEKHHIIIRTGQKIQSLESLKDYDFVVVTTGGYPQEEKLKWLQHETVTCVPSLFTFNIKDLQLQALMGTVVENATVFFPGTKMKANGALLITHWGMSGPAILRLSSYGARLLAEQNYQMPIGVNWCGRSETEIRQKLSEIIIHHPQKQVMSIRPFALPTRLWNYLAKKCLGERASYRWSDINKKEQNKLVNLLLNDEYKIDGRATFKDEFVTCGGISLNAVNPSTLESKSHQHLYFAGEVLDIDGVTGGFNFQAAWTTAYTVASAIKNECQNEI